MLRWSFQPQVVLNDDSPDTIMFMGHFAHPTKEAVDLVFTTGLLKADNAPARDFVVTADELRHIVPAAKLEMPDGMALCVTTDDPDTAIKAICEHIVKTAESDPRFIPNKPFMPKLETTCVHLKPVELV
jgi:hypothetical protein